MFLQVVYLFLACDAELPYRGYDLHFRSEYLEHYVEPYLVIPGSCAAVRHRTGPCLLDMLQHFECLEHALRTYRKRICRVFQHITENQILKSVPVVCVHGVYIHMRGCAEIEGALLY